MSAIALHRTEDRVSLVRPAIDGTRRWRSLIVASALIFPVVFYLMLLGVLMVQYGHLPNYLTPYNWIANALHIIGSTRSIADMVPIILDEWLIETGYINYDYGHGVAEWSMSIVPHRLAIVALAGALVGLNVALLLDQPMTGTFSRQVMQMGRFGLLTGAGALCASVTNATVFSVVHCATPSWVGSLAVLGFDSYSVFALEPYGPLICAFGFAALALSAILLARDSRAAAKPSTLRHQTEAASC